MSYGRRRGDARVLALCGGMVVPGGAERMTFEVLRAFRDRGAPVHCILNGWAYARIAGLADDIGATWSTSAYRVRLQRRTLDPRAHVRQLADMWRTNVDLIAAARTFKPTHILVPDHEAVLRNYAGLMALRAAGVPVIMKLCNAPAQTPFYRRLWRHVVTPCVDRFICNSQFTARELAALGVPSGKTTTIYETLPHRGARRPLGAREARRVVFAGQIIPPKGLHLLLDAIGMLAARQVEVSLDVIGDLDGWISPVYGAYRDEIRHRASRDDLAGRVRFLGWRDDVIEVMAEAAVHCCPSLPEIRESFGLVVLEAKAAGVPSVVFPSGALVEQVTDGVDGLVCASPTADALAEAIGTFLADPAWLNEAGAAAAKSASRFDQATFARSWWGVITGYWTGAPPAGRRPAPAFGNESYEHPRH